VRAGERPSKKISFGIQSKMRERKPVPPGFFAKKLDTVSSCMLVPTIQHIFEQHACSSQFPTCGSVISFVSPTNQTQLTKGTEVAKKCRIRARYKGRQNYSDTIEITHKLTNFGPVLHHHHKIKQASKLGTNGRSLRDSIS